MGKHKELEEMFYDFVTSLIDESGIYPHQCMAVFKSQDEGARRFDVAAIADNPDRVYGWFWDQVCNKGAVEVMMGLDRTTAPNQGTEFADVLTVLHWKEGLNKMAWPHALRVGVINYQHEPRIVRPIDWDNKFWHAHMIGEAKQFCPPMRIKVS